MAATLGELPLRSCAVRPDRCAVCDKTGTPETGKPNSPVASLIIKAAGEVAPYRGPGLLREYGPYLRQLTPADEPVAGPCRHRGEVVRREPCKPCRGVAIVDVHSCELYDLCVTSHARRLSEAAREQFVDCRECDDQAE